MRRKSFRSLEELGPSEGLLGEPAIEPEAGWPELRSVGRELPTAQDLGLWRLAEESDRLTRWRPVLLKPHPRTERSALDWPSPDWPDAA